MTCQIFLVQKFIYIRWTLLIKTIFWLCKFSIGFRIVDKLHSRRYRQLIVFYE